MGACTCMFLWVLLHAPYMKGVGFINSDGFLRGRPMLLLAFFFQNSDVEEHLKQKDQIHTITQITQQFRSEGTRVVVYSNILLRPECWLQRSVS